MEETTTVKFLDFYLRCIGITDFNITANQDDIGYLVIVEISKNNPKIGVLKGKNGKNLNLLKNILRVVGLNERKNPFLIVKLV
jgi:hypothetical protein